MRKHDDKDNLVEKTPKIIACIGNPKEAGTAEDSLTVLIWTYRNTSKNRGDAQNGSIST